MHPLLIALALLALLYFGIKMAARTDPRLLARRMKLIGGGSMLAAAVVLAATGRWGAAISLAIVGFSLAGQEFMRSVPSSSRAQNRPRRSEVRSARLVMWLDHATGAMGGRVLNGRFAGVALDALSDRDLEWLREDVRNDPDSSNLIEAYLDRRSPGWRAADKHGPTQRNGRPRPMTEEEAYQILGLAPASDEESVRRAHRSLMKRLHPDQGGSSYLAARVNEARDLLLRKLRRPA